MTDTTQMPEPIWDDAISLCADLQSGVVDAVTVMGKRLRAYYGTEPKAQCHSQLTRLRMMH